MKKKVVALDLIVALSEGQCCQWSGVDHKSCCVC